MSGKDICCGTRVSFTPGFRRRENTDHKVTLGELELVGKSLLLSIVCRPLNLVVVVVEANDVGASELDNLPSGTSNTTSDIQNAHALLDVDHVGEIVLVTGNGLTERLVICEAAEVEALAPAILVQVGGEIVVAEHEGLRIELVRGGNV